MKSIYVTLAPNEIAEYIECRGEAKDIIVHILRKWILQQPAYEDILDEIPGYVIKHYLSGEITATLREKIEAQIKKIEEDDIMQQPKALVQINAPMALMQCTREGQMQALNFVLELLDKEENDNHKQSEV